jgi:hypothetical protein
MEKDITVFEVDVLVKEVYDSIALWHNDNPNKESLKILSLELVEKISSSAFQHLGLGGANLTTHKNDVELK